MSTDTDLEVVPQQGKKKLMLKKHLMNKVAWDFKDNRKREL